MFVRQSEKEVNHELALIVNVKSPESVLALSPNLSE